MGGNESLAPQDDAQEIQIRHSCHSADTGCADGVFAHESLKIKSLKKNMSMTIDTTNLCSHLQKKLFEPEGVYYPIWQGDSM